MAMLVLSRKGLQPLATPATTHSHNTRRLLFCSLEGKKEPRKSGECEPSSLSLRTEASNGHPPTYLGKESGTLLVPEIKKINLNIEKLVRPMNQLWRGMEILVLDSKLQILRQQPDKEEKPATQKSSTPTVNLKKTDKDLTHYGRNLLVKLWRF